MNTTTSSPAVEQLAELRLYADTEEARAARALLRAIADGTDLQIKNDERGRRERREVSRS